MPGMTIPFSSHPAFFVSLLILHHGFPIRQQETGSSAWPHQATMPEAYIEERNEHR
jgi:hypothetical protein